MDKNKYSNPVKGTEYGNWTLTSNKVYRKNRAAYWEVKCKCGLEGQRMAAQLVNGTSYRCKSCSKARWSGHIPSSYYSKLKQRSKNKEFKYNLTVNYLNELFDEQNEKCALSGEDIFFHQSYNTSHPQTASLDRIDNEKGYIKGNVQWVHKDVNFMKGMLNEDRFIKLCKKISENS